MTEISEEKKALALRARGFKEVIRPALTDFKAQLPEIHQRHPILGAMLQGYISLTELTLSGAADSYSETKQQEINRQLRGLEERIPWPESGTFVLGVALEYISAQMHEVGYTAEERHDERTKLQKGKRGRPHVGWPAICALEFHLFYGKSDCEIADVLCDYSTSPHKRGEAGQKHKRPFPDEENVCAGRFRDRRENLQKFLESCGVEIVPGPRK
jgi:hypothetical protein